MPVIPIYGSRTLPSFLATHGDRFCSIRVPDRFTYTWSIEADDLVLEDGETDLTYFAENLLNLADDSNESEFQIVVEGVPILSRVPVAMRVRATQPIRVDGMIVLQGTPGTVTPPGISPPSLLGRDRLPALVVTWDYAVAESELPAASAVTSMVAYAAVEFLGTMPLDQLPDDVLGAGYPVDDVKAPEDVTP